MLEEKEKTFAWWRKQEKHLPERCSPDEIFWQMDASDKSLPEPSPEEKQRFSKLFSSLAI